MTAVVRVAVTGAGGFIGSNVCRLLARHGYEVVALTGAPGDRVVAPPDVVREVRAAITDREALRDLLGDDVQAVVHLAGPPSVRASFDDAYGYAHAHTAGTAALLDVCRERAVKRLVFVSSAEVYGNPKTNPVDELQPLEARSPYAAAKIGAEHMVRAFDRQCGNASVIFRPFSVYGSTMSRYALLPAIVTQIGRPGPIVLADLRPERDYCHVDDVARAIVAAIPIETADTLTLNVGTGVGTSVAELARMVLRIAGSEQEIKEASDARRPGHTEILRLVCDRRSAAALLDWVPNVTLEAGLRQVIDAFARTK